MVNHNNAKYISVPNLTQLEIFCDDYGNIASTLFLIEQNYQKKKITLIIPSNHDLFLFFDEINKRVFNNKVSLIFQPGYTPRRAQFRGIKKIFHILPDILGERKYLANIYKQYFAKTKESHIYFFSRGYSGKTFYLLKKSSKKNSIVFMPYQNPASPYKMSQYKPFNISDLLVLIINKLIYGLDIGLGKYPEENPLVKGFVYMPDRFIQENVSVIITPEERSKMMKGFNLDKYKIFNTSRYRVIYFDDGLIGNNYPGYGLKKDVFKKEIAAILHVLTKYFPEKEIAYKYHPGYNNDKTLINTGECLPDFIPAEFLYDKHVLIYMSIASLSIANVESGAAISIIDMITFPNLEIKKQYKNYLSSVSKTKILFPQSLKEFESIIAKISKMK